MRNFFSISLALFLAIDAFGILPSYLHVLKKTDFHKRKRVVFRELFFALIIMFLFHYLGIFLLKLLNLTHTTVEIASGIVLFLIAVRLIFNFPDEKEKMSWGNAPPFVVPIATPLIAGPSVLAVIMISSQASYNDIATLEAIFVSWFFASIVLIFANPIYKFIGDKGVSACEKLMGLILALIGVETFMHGIKALVGIQ